MIHSQEHAEHADTPTTVRHERAVYFIEDVAELLGCSTRTIMRRLKYGPLNGMPRPLPSVDRRQRWSKAVFDQWLATNGKEGAERPAAGRRVR